MNIIKGTRQLMHSYVEPVSGFYCTFVYTFNQSRNREVLWHDLGKLKTSHAWIIF